MRKGELFKIKYNDVDFNKSLLHLYETKNSEDRIIPLSKKAIMILKSMPRRFDGKVFPLTRDTLKSWWYTALRKAKIKDFRWHDLRRVACSRLFEKAKDHYGVIIDSNLEIDKEATSKSRNKS